MSSNDRGGYSADSLDGGVDCMDSVSNRSSRNSVESLNRGVDCMDSMSKGSPSNDRGRKSTDSLDGVSKRCSSNKSVCQVTSMGDHSSMSVGDHVGGDVRGGSSRGYGEQEGGQESLHFCPISTETLPMYSALIPH